MSQVLFESLRAWCPEAIFSLGALLVLAIAGFAKRASLALAVGWATVIAVGVALWRTTIPEAGIFFGLIISDPFSLTLRWIMWGSVAIVLLLLVASRDIGAAVRSECIGLLLLIGVGLMLMAEANHLLMAYVAMELVSLSSYVLVGLLPDARSAEASLKYLLFGALSSAIMLFGMSLLFGLTGSLGFHQIQLAVSLGGSLASTPIAHVPPEAMGSVVVAVVLMLAGLAFKISMVPFHMWTPDAYEGAPVPVTALLSVGPKAAGLALLIRLMTALAPALAAVTPILIVLTIITMTLGNLVALAQTNVKRLLAYSTIGQVGYLLIGFVVNTNLGLTGLLMYLVAYLFMNLGAFACVVAVVNEAGNESLDAFRGLARRAPVLALLCALFLLSLAGIPPLLGFFGKFLLFGSALHAHRPILAFAGILNSAIALYYYVNIIRLMYLHEPADHTPLALPASLRWAVGLCAAATVLLGLFPGPLLKLLSASTLIRLL